MPISTYLGNALLDHVLRNDAYTPPATVYVSLHDGDPGLTGDNEIAGGSYARQATAWDAAASKASANTATETWTDLPAVTVTHVGIWDAATSGNFLWGGALNDARVIHAGGTATFAAGELDITI